MSRKQLDRPLLTGCSMRYKPRPLHVNKQESRQSKKV